MKIVMVLIALCTVPVATLAAGDAPRTQPPQVKVEKVEDGGAFKSLLDQVWARLRTYGPSVGANDRREKTATLVAGVRGTEATSSALNPYWKGDKTHEPAYLAEVSAYNKAQGLAEGGDLKQAVAAFQAFVTTYPGSTLKPNAVFALGLAYAGLGDKAHGTAFLQAFIKDYPDHPLATDAGRLMEEMQKI